MSERRNRKRMAMYFDYGKEAQQAAEAHLDAIYEYEREVGGDDSPSIGAWCGCQTCIIREVLFAAWPSLRDAALNGAE